MAQNVTVAGASYSAVPSVDLPTTGGGISSFYDVSDTTATASDVASGTYFYTSAGVRTLGTASGGGGSSSWTHLAHAEYELSTTSTSWVTVGSIDVGLKGFNAARFIYVRVRDKAGSRVGYYSGSDMFIPNSYALAASGGSLRYGPIYYTYSGSGTNPWSMASALYSSAYGIVAYSVQRKSTNSMPEGMTINLRAKYSSSVTKTIDGTYDVDVFALSCPTGYPTVFGSPIDGKYRVFAYNSSFASADKTEAASGETVTVTVGAPARSFDMDIIANIGEGGEYVTLISHAEEGQTATFTMPSRSVNILPTPSA